MKLFGHYAANKAADRSWRKTHKQVPIFLFKFMMINLSRALSAALHFSLISSGAVLLSCRMI